MKLEEIKGEVKRLDPKLKVTDEAFFVATVLLAALQVGAERKKVAEFLGVTEKRIAKYAKNLEKSGVWKDGKTSCEWFDKECSGVAFWLDVAVAEGLVERES